MTDKIKFPKTMKEFIDSYSFKDEEQIYTNGAELIPVFRVEQALEHYKNEIRNDAIDEFAEKIFYYCSMSNMNATMIRQIAEQLKGE